MHRLRIRTDAGPCEDMSMTLAAAVQPHRLRARRIGDLYVGASHKLPNSLLLTTYLPSWVADVHLRRHSVSVKPETDLPILTCRRYRSMGYADFRHCDLVARSETDNVQSRATHDHIHC